MQGPFLIKRTDSKSINWSTMIFVYVLTLAALSTIAHDIKSNCIFSTKGESGVLVCVFSVNISETKYNFAVQRYDLNHNATKPEPILHCTWLSSGLECLTGDGYIFDKKVSTIFAMYIPKVKRDMEGQYVCQVVGDEDVDYEYCRLEYEESLGKDNSTNVTSSYPAVSGDQPDRSGLIYRSTTIGLAVLLFVTIAVCVVLAKRAITRSLKDDDVGAATREEHTDFEKWGIRQHLAPETIHALKLQDFKSVGDLQQLTAKDITECLRKTGLLSLAQSLALKKAVQRLSEVERKGSHAIARLWKRSCRSQNGARDEQHTEHESFLCEITDGIEDWATRERLTPRTIHALKSQGFTSVDELRELTAEDITECFQKQCSLPLASCLALKTAIQRLSEAGRKGDRPTGGPEISPITSGTRSFQRLQELEKEEEEGPFPSRGIEDWATRERLAPKTIHALKSQGFTSVDDLRELTAEDITECFHRKGLLLLAQCLALKKAVRRLSEEETVTMESQPHELNSLGDVPPSSLSGELSAEQPEYQRVTTVAQVQPISH